MRAKNSAAAQHHPNWHTKCPYNFVETPDGRLIIDGEDFGDKETALAHGQALSSVVRMWHEVAKESR